MAFSVLHQQSAAADKPEWMLQSSLSILVLSQPPAKVLYSAFLHLWVNSHNAPLLQPTCRYAAAASPVTCLP